eukprot:637534-Pyramimonas_sp.AAC.1
MIATNLIEKFSKNPKKSQPAWSSHTLPPADHSNGVQRPEGRLLTGREMVRAICHWCSVRSELGQHRISRDIFKVVMDPHKPDAD